MLLLEVGFTSRFSRPEGMFCRPTLLFSRLTLALWLLLFGAAVVLLRRS